MRVVLDTNVVVSAFLSPAGAPARIVALWRDEAFELVVSDAILSEYHRALRYDRVRARHRMTDEGIAAIIAGFREFAVLVAPSERLDVVREDPDDNRFLEAALAGAAQHIVSGDVHLLRLGEYRGVYVLSPAAFLALISQHHTP